MTLAATFTSYTVNDLIVLAAVREHGPCPVKVVDESVPLRKSAVYNHMIRLLADGLVERRRRDAGANGRPPYTYSITAEGERELRRRTAT